MYLSPLGAGTRMVKIIRPVSIFTNKMGLFTWRSGSQIRIVYEQPIKTRRRLNV